MYLEIEDGVTRTYLTVQQVLRLYTRLFDCETTQAADQLRNRLGLQGALDRSRWYAHYQNADLPLQAAVLAHGIAETQPFIEGNKRIALLTMLTFLELNGFWIDVSADQSAAWMLGLANGVTPQRLAEQIREHGKSFRSDE